MGARLLAALVAAAERRQVSAFVGVNEPPLAIVLLPELGAGVAIVDRGDDAPEALRLRVDALLAGHANGILHLVVAGGRAADRAQDREVLIAADREAHDPNRLGVHRLDASGRLERVAGRRLGLLGEAAALVDRVQPLDAAAVERHNAEAQKRRDEAAAFAAALDHRSQRATRLLGVANILMFALTMLWGERSFTRALVNLGGNSAVLVEAGQIWRLVSHAFLHGDPAHLLVNLIGLFSFGGFLEGLLGWRRIVLVYGLSALAGGLASVFIGDVTLSVGASGAIWGLMGTGVGIVIGRQKILPPLIAGRLRPRLLAVLGLNAAFSLLPLFVPGMPRIDLWAHAGGGLAGFVLAASGLLTLGLVPGSPPQGAAANPTWLRVSAALVLLMLAGSVAVALATGQPWQPQVILQPDELV